MSDQAGGQFSVAARHVAPRPPNKTGGSIEPRERARYTGPVSPQPFLISLRNSIVSATAVVGLQWGDEAKGKIVDLLTSEHDIVIRYQGGNNAGHTVKFDGETYKLSLMPAGVLHDHIVSVVATGASRKGEAIGTTMRGIGTCYREKAGRAHAVRIGDLLYPDLLRRRLQEIVAYKNQFLKTLDPSFQPFDADAIFAEYSAYTTLLTPYICDTTAFLHRALAAKKRLLFEGAQGSLLDLDHGTFPYVTSSSSSGCGIHSGSGVPERTISRMIGIVKAYTTRVGGGPFPTELNNEIGQHIRDVGHEYGTVTGRPRRCGWFDAVVAGYGARISGVDCLAVMLLDVLSGLDELKICETYEIDDERTTDFPSHVERLARVQPIYRTFPGWKSDISHIRRVADLPTNARRYVDTISELLHSRVEIISVGPDREQTILS